MSRVVFNQSRMFMRKPFTNIPSSFTNRALFSTGIQRFQQQQQKSAQNNKNITHFGFRDVAEEDKESLGKLTSLIMCLDIDNNAPFFYSTRGLCQRS
jgi:hypothetical protein